MIIISSHEIIGMEHRIAGHGGRDVDRTGWGSGEVEQQDGVLSGDQIARFEVGLAGVGAAEVDASVPVDGGGLGVVWGHMSRKFKKL